MLEIDNNPTEPKLETNLKAIGIGGAGGNAINTMIELGQEDVEFWAVNTDVKDLKKSKAKNILQIGKKITKGFGAGSNPDIGRKSAEESKEEIRHMLEGADLAFIVAGMGGGTGTGAAPVVSAIAKEMGILTVGIVNSPFAFDGKKKMNYAKKGIEKLREAVDTLIVVPNIKLQEIYSKETIINVFKIADKILYEGAKAISDIIKKTGFINVDFADVKTVMHNRGYALMGIGFGEGDNRAIQAAESAMKNPLLSDLELADAKGLLINVTVGSDFKMEEYSAINELIVKRAGEDGDIIPGLVFDDDMEGKIKVTLIATGLRYSSAQMRDVVALKEETKVDEDIKNTFKRIKNTKTVKPPNYPGEKLKDVPAFIRRMSN